MNKFLFTFAALLAVCNAGYIPGYGSGSYGRPVPELIGHGYLPNPAATVEIIPSYGAVYGAAPVYGPASSYGSVPSYGPAPSVGYLAAPASYGAVNYAPAAPVQSASAASAAAAASAIRDNGVAPSYSVPAYPAPRPY